LRSKKIGKINLCMLKSISALALFVFICAFSLKAEAGAYTIDGKYASIVMDANSGRIINEVNSDKQLYPASLTKMMTLYLTFEALENKKIYNNTYLRVSNKAARQPPSSLGLRAGEAISTKDAILAIVTKSANDVAVVLAEAVGGSEEAFVKKMNAKAKKLGMNRTNFANASGLFKKEQYSTAHDIAVLGQALIKDYPGYYKLFKTPTFTFRGNTYRNHNKLMAYYDGMDGLKTGYITASGFNLAASAIRDGKRLIGVVFGGKSAKARNMVMRHLLDNGFSSAGKMQLASLNRSKVMNTVPARRPDTLSQIAPVARVASAAPTQLSRDSLMERIQRTFLPSHQITEASYEEDQGDASIDDEDNNSWTIQIGSFKDKFRSLQAIKDTKEHLEFLVNAEDAVAPLVTDRGVIYRARITGVSLDAARTACDMLKGKCLILTED